MKKLWNKFKHWLIKKLGGYTMPLSMPTPKIECYYEKPIALYAEFAVDYNWLDRDERGIEHKIKTHLADRILNELIEKKLLDITVTDDPIWRQKIYKARLMIYTTKGADNEQRD